MATARQHAVKTTMANIVDDRRGSLPVRAKAQQLLVDENKRRVRRYSEIQPAQRRSFSVNMNDRDVLLPEKARKLLGLQETTKKRSKIKPTIGRSPSAPESSVEERRYTKRKFFKSEKLRRWISNLQLTPEDENNTIESTPENNKTGVPSIVIDSCSNDSDDFWKENGIQTHAFEEGLLSPFYTLDAAVASGDKKLLEAILCSGTVKPDAVNASGGTAMHEAAFQGKLDCLRVFLRFGVDINIRDKEGWTPLHAAVCGGDVKCVTFLLRHGARTDIETDEGVRPVQIALQAGERRIVQAISNANADRGVRRDGIRKNMKSQRPQQRAWENIYGSTSLRTPKNVLPEKMIHERNNKVTQDLGIRNRPQPISPHIVYF